MSLQQIADALSVTPAAFFGDNGAGKDHAIGGEFAGSLTTPGALRLIGNYAKLPPGQRDALGPIDIQDSHWERVLIHCASDQLIRSAMPGEAVRAH